ncbi:MAG: maleylpyruvate isomerase N-terminal domain-containing protein, partial [Acidimicrobiales bacterium]
AGVPLHVDGDVEAPAAGWRSQRARLRAWLGSTPDADWSGATRCGLWDMTALVRHLVSGAQFLGYTLHQAAVGEPTSLLRDFDTHATVQAAAAMLGDLTPADARRLMAAMDASVDDECTNLSAAGWSLLAEAPPGQLPAHLAVSHFLFDSWVHEHDLMLPRGEEPTVDPLEVEVVVRYVVGIASLLTGTATALDVRVTHPELRIGVRVSDRQHQVTVGSAPAGAAVIEGRAVDVVDRATGRAGAAVRGDDRGLAVLDGLALVLTR